MAMRSHLVKLVCLLALLGLGCLLSACEYRKSITIENQTDAPVTLFFEDDEDAAAKLTIPAGEEKKLTIVPESWHGVLIARNPGGEVVFAVEIPWDELRKLDRIIIPGD